MIMKQKSISFLTASLLVAAFACQEPIFGREDESLPPSPKQIQEFRCGTIDAFSKWIGEEIPVILVSAYKRDVQPQMTPRGQVTNVVYGVTFARVVQSRSTDLKTGDIVAFRQDKEGLTPTELLHFENPRGELYYIVRPNVDKVLHPKIVFLLEGCRIIPVMSYIYSVEECR